MRVMYLKKKLEKFFPAGSDGRWILSCLYHNRTGFLKIFFKSVLATKKLTGRFCPILVRLSKNQNIVISKERDSIVEIKGKINVDGWGGLNSVSTLTVSSGAVFRVYGDFVIGPGVHISVEKNGTLNIGGKFNSSGSGITCNSRIMVDKFVEIGTDTIIAWDVLITDSDWHYVNDTIKSIPIFIGRHVWISHGVSILKGSNIPSGCIVGAKSLVCADVFQENCLIAGIPARVCKENIKWTR